METQGEPHQALFIALSYLTLDQLLTMSQVCKSVREAIAEDTLVWLDLIVECPLNLRIIDCVLINISAKARGRLRTLGLINCARITDDGLLKVVDANPFLTKIYLPGCVGITPEGVLSMVKKLTGHNPNTLTNIKVNGIYNFNQEHLKTLQFNLPKGKSSKLRFYHKYNSHCFRTLDDEDRPIDVETCGKCKEVKLVFDCPREICMMEAAKGRMKCKACGYCIQRCEGCGRCIIDEGDDEQVETICNDSLCQECWLLLPKCGHCNKPFCPRHGALYEPEGCVGFVCDICKDKTLL